MDEHETFSSVPEARSAFPENEIVTTRVFEHSVRDLFRAWSEPQLLAAWWGPAGFTNTFNTFEFEAGGCWDFVMHGPEKGNYHNVCEFTHITPERHIAWKRHSKPSFRVDVAFAPAAEKKTHVTFRQIFDSVEECEKIRKYTVGKNDENFDRLEAVLGKMVKKE